MPEEPSIEYETADGEYWGTENWTALSSTFSLTPNDLARWHKAMSGQGRAWEIIRRLYQVTTIIKPDPEALRKWTLADLAKHFGISQAHVKEEIAGAQKHWNQRDATTTAAKGIDGLSDDDFIRLTNFSEGRGLDEEKVKALLSAHGFDHIIDPKFRAEMALRIVSLHRFLGSSHQRTQAMEILRLEATMHANRILVIHNQNQISRLISDDAVGVRSGEIQKYQERIEALEDRITKAAKAHTDACEAIGANELDTIQRKKMYIETVTHLVEQSALWNKGPEHWRADGTWTADEIEWLMNPVGDRPNQYRFDIALRTSEAMDADNFWNPDFVPRNIPRLVCERLARIMRNLAPLGSADDDEKILENIGTRGGDANDDEELDDEDEHVAAVSDDTEQLVAVDAADSSPDSPPPAMFGKTTSSSFKAFETD